MVCETQVKENSNYLEIIRIFIFTSQPDILPVSYELSSMRCSANRVRVKELDAWSAPATTTQLWHTKYRSIKQSINRPIAVINGSLKMFAGMLLILLGVLMLLSQLDIIQGNMWHYFWPAVIILVGAWLLFKNSKYSHKSEPHS